MIMRHHNRSSNLVCANTVQCHIWGEQACFGIVCNLMFAVHASSGAHFVQCRAANNDCVATNCSSVHSSIGGEPTHCQFSQVALHHVQHCRVGYWVCSKIDRSRRCCDDVSYLYCTAGYNLIIDGERPHTITFAAHRELTIIK